MERREIAQQFDRAAPRYEQHDALEREVAERLLDRLEFARRPPSSIIDLGCGPGRAAEALKRRFGAARVQGLDVSRGMLNRLRSRSSELRPLSAICADFMQLPLAARSADLVFANLSLQWAGDFGRSLSEIRRVLRPGGMLLFSLPGPGSFAECLEGGPDERETSIPFFMPDLRDVGDLLVAAGFSDPVMDAETITLRYPDRAALAAELAATGGAGFIDLAGGHPQQGGLSVSFEVVYGTAFGPREGQPIRTEEGDVATFSLEALRKIDDGFAK